MTTIDTKTAYNGIHVSFTDSDPNSIYVIIASIPYTVTRDSGNICIKVRDGSNIMTIGGTSYDEYVCVLPDQDIIFRSDIMSPFGNRLRITLLNLGSDTLAISFDYQDCEIDKFKPIPLYWQWLNSQISNLNRPYPRQWSDFNNDYYSWRQMIKFGFDSLLDFHDLPDEPAVEEYV